MTHKQVTIGLDQSADATLTAIAKKEGISIDEVVSRALAIYARIKAGRLERHSWKRGIAEGLAHATEWLRGRGNNAEEWSKTDPDFTPEVVKEIRWGGKVMASKTSDASADATNTEPGLR